MSLRLIFQMIRFGAVGLIASALHYMMAVAMIGFDVWPLWANFFAFVIAFHVSFFGHFYWTFAHVQAFRCSVALRFFCVAVLGFCFNESLYYCFLRWTDIRPQWSLLFVLLFVAALTFQLSRLWAFRVRRLDPI
ncbi:GtrA family protein [Coraliomargarita sp. W4R72]